MSRKQYVAFIIGILLCIPCHVWAQVKGECYNVPEEKNNNIKVVSASPDTQDSKDLQNIADNKNNTSWKAAKGGDAMIVFDLGKSDNQIIAVDLLGSANVAERSEKILFEQSESPGGGWITVYEFENLNTNNERYWLSLYKQEQEITSRYVRMTLKVDSPNDTISLREVTFYDKIPNWSVKHKKAKWFSLRNGVSDDVRNLDSFNDDEEMFHNELSGKDIQAAHTYIDTIYVHRGQTVELTIPDYEPAAKAFSVCSYQRWYSFRTDSTFRTRDNEVKDLLTPVDGSVKAYRLNNGYIGLPMGDKVLGKMNFYYPKEDEFNEWFPDAKINNFDSNWFVVACDVSAYTDYTEDFDSNSKNSKFQSTHYEPTLTHRILYYIVAVDDPTTPAMQQGHNRLMQEEYQGATVDNFAGKKFLEEYEITFPFYRIFNAVSTQALVTLSKDARSYAVPNISLDEKLSAKLTATVVSNDAGITIDKSSISGEQRVIKFNYPEKVPSYTDILECVKGEDRVQSTIIVTKVVDGKTYNIARYKLTFRKESSLLTQSMMAQLDSVGYEWKGEPWEGYGYRTLAFMERNYRKLTGIDWDYDKDVAALYGSKDFYTFPMAWEYSGYGFYDGATGGDYKPSQGNRYYPEWAYYAIMSGFMEANSTWAGSNPTNKNAKPLPGSSYHLFIDASDRPGNIVHLPFRQNLCRGTELFISAWVKGGGWSKDSDDAGMLFTIMGVDEEGAMTPLYRFSPGAIRRSDYLSSSLPGCGSGTNEWMQVYFSFINDSEIEYDSYLLRVDNYSNSTKGGDMYLDDVRVYMAMPSAEVKQMEVNCMNDRTRMNVKIDWERLLSRTGAQELTGDESVWHAFDFCFIDSLAFRDALEGKASPTAEEIKAAIEASVMEIGGGSDEYNYKYARLYYNQNFDKNKSYVEAEETYNDGALAKNNRVDINGNMVSAFYGDKDSRKALAVDFYSKLSPNRPYIMLMHIPEKEEAGSDKRPDVGTFKDCLDACAMKSEFWVTSQNVLKMNGEIVDPTTDYCAGQIFKFSITLKVEVVEDGERKDIIIDDGVYMDWFFGSEKEYLEAQPQENGETVSLNDALIEFRNYYPDADALSETTTAPKETFTRDMYDLLYRYSTTQEEGLNHRLVLHRENLDIELLEDGLELVVKPIRVETSVDEVYETVMICWDYIPLVLHTSGKAPGLHAGFNYMKYPVDFNPALRIGLSQIQKATDEKHALTVDLRNVKVTSDDVIGLGPVSSVPARRYIFLIDTDDPEMKGFIPEDGTFTEYDLPIGWLDTLTAEKAKGGTAKIHFDLEGKLVETINVPLAKKGFKFTPREGYTYTFVVHFEEQVGTGKVGNSCFGQFPVEMKVVPEYLVWDGEATSNWNNDDNWKRVAEKDRLNKPDSDPYPEDGNVTVNAFVPMLFSKVIIPQGAKVELYKAGFDGMADDENVIWVDKDKPSHIGKHTDNIQYDMMAYEHPEGSSEDAGSLTTERYRVNMVDEIHFESGAEMLHPEYLMYNKAYLDYRLEQGRWFSLSVPLKGVVAGDFYTGKSGEEEGEYFHPVIYDKGKNDRFAPSVYQRGWKAKSTMLKPLGDEDRDVAVAGDWSALYNDVDERYVPGTGFSLKVQDAPDGNGVVFRLPKSDEGYIYYNKDGTSDNIDITVERGEEAGRLATDVLFVRDVDYDKAEDGKPITVMLPEEANGERLCLVGNPFLTRLDMSKFFEKNGDVLEQKLWLEDENGQEVAVGSENGWITSLENMTVPPLRSFFVQKKANALGSELRFTADMQAAFEVQQTKTAENVLRILAVTDDGRQSRAMVAFRAAASGGYEQKEDAELFLNNSLEEVPVVYTVGSTRALSVNVTSADMRIPLAVHSASDEMVTLRFSGDACNGTELYDAHSHTYTSLYDGFELKVASNEHGRYYLWQGGYEVHDMEEENSRSVSVYSVRSGEIVVVSSDVSLASVQVYTVDGRLVAEEDGLPEATTFRCLSVPGKCNYVVVVKDNLGHKTTVKLRVK